MPDWIADARVMAALISAIVASIGTIVTLRIALRGFKEQAKLKSLELENQAKLKKDELEEQVKNNFRELEALADQLRVEQEGLRQAQLTEVLKKRIETYPILYEIISVYGRNWEIEGKTRNHAWAKTFLKALIDNNAQNGAFFSKTVYEWYGYLRTFLEELTEALATGRVATDDEIARLYGIIRGPICPSGDRRDPGLGSYIKDELGSYITAIVSATHTYPEIHNHSAERTGGYRQREPNLD